MFLTIFKISSWIVSKILTLISIHSYGPPRNNVKQLSVGEVKLGSWLHIKEVSYKSESFQFPYSNKKELPPP